MKLTDVPEADLKFMTANLQQAIALPISNKSVGAIRAGRFLYFEERLNRVFLDLRGFLFTVDVRAHHAQDFAQKRAEYVLIRHEGLIASATKPGQSWHKISVEWTARVEEVEALIPSVIATCR